MEERFGRDSGKEGFSKGGDRGDRGDRGDKGGGDRGPRGGGFSRKKVCPFILDKKLLLDYKNMRVIQRFITETGRIVPRRVSGVCAKNQRKLTQMIKRARNIGFIAPLMEE